jgi:hypothetical protein
MVLETSHFYITLSAPYTLYGTVDFDWVRVTWRPPFRLKTGNFKEFLLEKCGKRAVGSISLGCIEF